MKLKQYTPHLWCALFIISALGFSIERHYLAKSIQAGFRYLVIDDTCFFLPKSFEFKDAHDLHFDQAQLVCETLLNRGPAGVDNQARLKNLFHPTAYEKVIQLVENEAADFKSRSIHQKVSIAETRQLKMKDESVLIQVTGQLIRMGQFSGKSFIEILDFECQLHFIPNLNMLSNGRYPTIVFNYNLKTKAIPSS